MSNYIRTFENLDGQTVHTVIIPRGVNGHPIERYLGTYASEQEAAARVRQFETGTMPKWEEPE